MILKIMMIFIVSLSFIGATMGTTLDECSWYENEISFYLVPINSPADPCAGSTFGFKIDYGCSDGDGNGCGPIRYTWDVYRIINLSGTCNYIWIDGDECIETDMEASCGDKSNDEFICLSPSWMVCGYYYMVSLNLYSTRGNCQSVLHPIGTLNAYLSRSCFGGWTVVDKITAGCS